MPARHTLVMRTLTITLILAALMARPLPAAAQSGAQAPTTVSATGGSQGASQRVPAGQDRFGFRVPLRPNADNLLDIAATDDQGRTASVDGIHVAQISLTDVVQARVTAQRLSTPEVRQLVADGVINVADPDNYNVSRFVIALVVGGQHVEVPVPVVRNRVEPLGVGEEISVGCAPPGEGLQTSGSVIRIPCGGGGGGAEPPPPPDVTIVPFEIASEVPGMPSVPGVILIEGRIKTLKEFFKVQLLLMNVSSLFTLTDLTARLEMPEGELSPVAPAGGSIAMPDIPPGSDATGEFIIRGDGKGLHTVTAFFGGKIAGSFLPEPLAFSGHASTDLEVKGPPKMDVSVSHPDYVTANVPYDLVVTIRNTDADLDALFTSLLLDVSGGADLLDEISGLPDPGPQTREIGDILRGQTVVRRFRVLPRVSGPITSCVGAATENIQLSVQFVGQGPGCAIGTLPSDRARADGKPTVTVVPAHNTLDVPLDPAITAIFSAKMITATITTGFPGASFNVLDPERNVVRGSLIFTELFGNTAAIFRPDVPLLPGTVYNIVVNPSVYNLDGVALASGLVARFTTANVLNAPDAVPPTVTLSLEPPVVADQIGRGQLVPLVAVPSDNVGVVRVDVLLDDQLIDTRRFNSTMRFLVDTRDLLPGSTHVLKAVAYDEAENRGTGEMTLHMVGDQTPPNVAIVVDGTVPLGRPIQVTVQASDDTRVARVELFVDSSSDPIGTSLVEPYRFSLPAGQLGAGSHSLRAIATDGAGNSRETTAAFTIAADTTPPVVTVVSPQGTRFRAGLPIAVAATISDNVGVSSVEYRLDAEVAPRATGNNGFTLDTRSLALGLHLLTITASDASGNTVTVPVPFELFIPAANEPPPAPPVAANVAPSTPSGGVVTVAGAPGTVPGGLAIIITNTANRAELRTTAAPDGSFVGQIEGHAGDTLRIVAVGDSGEPSAPITMTVPAAPTLLSISVTPAAVALDRSHPSGQLAIIGHFSDGSQQTLTSGLVFTSSAALVATAVGSGQVIPGQNGSATIHVATTTSGVNTVDVSVSVDFSTLTGITALPNPVTLNGLGQSLRLSVNAHYSDATSGPFSGSPRFATGNAAVAVVDNTGLVTSTGVGSTFITVAANGLPTTTALVVVNAVTTTDLIVSPNSVAFTSLSDTAALTPTFRFNDGTTGPAPYAVTYRSLDASVATVNAAGLIAAVGEGVTTIVVEALSYSVGVPVSIVLPTAQPVPIISSLGRPIAGHGDTLAILGKYFGASPQNNYVTVGGLHADVIGASADRLIAVVPQGATTGQVQVRVSGQDSNPVALQIYDRRAAAVLTSAPFNVTPAASGQVADMGSASFYLYPGDDVWLTGDPNTINGPTWTSLVGPTVSGSLSVRINGVDYPFSTSPQPANLTSLFGSITQPTLVTVSARIEAAGGQLSSRGLAIVAGPPSTGAFAGQRFLTGDTIGQQMVLRFRVAAPDGTRFAATAGLWYRLIDGGYHNGSAGGTVIGDPTPNDGSFRSFTAVGGEVAVPYSDAGLLADFGSPREVVVALLPADASGNRVGSTTPVGEARILLGALDSASTLPQQPTTIADGVDRPILVDVNSVRDNFGNRITDGLRIAATAGAYYRRDDGGYHNGSFGGTLSGGDVTPNDGSFRTYALVNGAAQLTYSAVDRTLDSPNTAVAVVALTVANDNNSRVTTRPFGEGTLMLSAPSADSVQVSVVPSQLAATSADNRSVITVRGLTDAGGRPVPDGTRIAVSPLTFYRLSDGGYHNGSFGGSILGGDVSPNDGNFRSFVVHDGEVTFTYSNAGLVLGRGETATTVISILPAYGNGSRIGNRPFAEARITQAGVTSATIVTTPASTIADGTRRPVAVAVTNIRDALGNPVPDGTRIALTASAWYRRSDGGYSNGSTGGSIIDGQTATNDGSFQIFSVMGGRVDATYSAESVPRLSVTDVRSSVIAATVASETGRVTITPFAEGVVAVSSISTGNASVAPTSLLADRQGRTAVVTITGLTDAQGVPVPDGTKVAMTASAWYRMADGGYHNGSAGGTMIDGGTVPNDGNFRSYTVNNGAVTATYSDSGLFVDVGGTAPAIVSVMPAGPEGSRIAERPFAAATVTLAGLDTGTFIAPATTSPGSTVSVTLSNIRDALGNLVPDGTRLAVTASAWYNRDGSYHNGSAGGTISGGAPTPNDGSFRTFVVSGGQITFTFTAPTSANVTSVISINSADGSGNRIATRPFVAWSIRVE